MGTGTRGHSGSVIAHVSKTPGDERDPALPMMTEVDRNKGHDGVGPDGLKANTEASSVWRGWREGWGGLARSVQSSPALLTLSNSEDIPRERQCFPEYRRSKSNSKTHSMEV